MKEKLTDLQNRDAAVIWHPYTQHAVAKPPVPIVRANGALLYDENDREIIDAVASWWTNTIGHAHPYLADAVHAQMLELEHVIFAGFTHYPAVELAEKLLPHLPEKHSRVFFSDSGSTAVEIGVKMAIQYFHNKKIKRKKLVTFDNAFHGETFGAMSASGDLGLNNAFAEHLFEVVRIPEPYSGQEEKSAAVLREVLENNDVYAFLFEPLLQGAGGMKMYAAAALDELISICCKADVLTIADEVMTGFYRTGKMFASDYLTQKPDVVCLGKGLTAGSLPLAVTTCTEKIFTAFLSDNKKSTLFHGHSFTGNPTGCAAAIASLEILEQEKTQRDIRRVCRRQEEFLQKLKPYKNVENVRRCGTILAMDFKAEGKTDYFNNLRDRLYDYFLERDVLLRPLGNVIYIMPPYCITDGQLDKVYAVIEEALESGEF